MCALNIYIFFIFLDLLWGFHKWWFTSHFRETPLPPPWHPLKKKKIRFLFNSMNLKVFEKKIFLLILLLLETLKQNKKRKILSCCYTALCGWFIVAITAFCFLCNYWPCTHTNGGSINHKKYVFKVCIALLVGIQSAF